MTESARDILCIPFPLAAEVEVLFMDNPLFCCCDFFYGISYILKMLTIMTVAAPFV